MTPKVRARERNAIGKFGPFAAPFDVPSGARIEITDDVITMSFRYGLGTDEESVGTALPGTRYALAGRISERIMSLQVKRETFVRDLQTVCDALRARANEMPDEPGTPMRRGAHFRFVAFALLPELEGLVSELIRRV
ncbi:MAG TPA: hypothetical protein VGM88_27170 [Kofleriaceae bacterium]